MGFVDLAKKRHTTYDFNDKKVSEGHITKILESGRWAPSLRNSQPWSFIVVRDVNTIDYLTRTANYGDFHTNPSLVIAVVLNRDRSLNYYKGEDERVSPVNFDNYMCCGMAALQMIFEATDLGIDSLTALAAAFREDETNYRIYIEQLFHYLEDLDATSFLISETEQIPTTFSKTGVEEFLADGVVVLYNIRHKNVRENAIEVLKLRGAKHEKKIVAMQILSGKGIVVYPEQEVFSDIGDEK